MSSVGFMHAAYAVVWIVLGGYLMRLSAMRLKLKRELSEPKLPSSTIRLNTVSIHFCDALAVVNFPVMQAIRVSYQMPGECPNRTELKSLEHWGRIVDFPTATSYVLYDCKEADVERCVLEVAKAVEAHPRGEEPGRLEIRFTE